jgi:hypothetical protein
VFCKEAMLDIGKRKEEWANQNINVVLVHMSDFEIAETYFKKFNVSGIENISECLITKNGSKPVGAIFRSTNSNGSLVLLPDIDFYHERFIEVGENGFDNKWTKSAKIFASEMIKEIVSIDKKLHNSGEITPEPDWAEDQMYSLINEERIKQELIVLEDEIQELYRIKDSKLEELRKNISYRGLLYEKGKPLERAIIEGLEILGFSASNFNNGDSEFDVVFQSKEGRLIGEAEGKDNNAIKIDKLRQLNMNILEDYDRDDVKIQAKGVLFGNSYRFTSPLERRDTFTEKCISSSNSFSIALVSTTDLFIVVRYLFFIFRKNLICLIKY